MMIFYTNEVEEVLMASIVKHFNPHALLYEYSDNNEILSIAKIHNENHFIRIKDYKLAILNKYAFPAWIKNDSRVRFIELVLANKHTKTTEVVTYLAKYLFNPEELFYSSIDKFCNFKTRAMQVINELSSFKKFAKKFYKNGLTYYEINPIHNIHKIFTNDLETEAPVIVLQANKAIIKNADLIGFEKPIIELSRYNALRLKKKLQIETPIKRIIKQTIATKISNF